jgi:hypothetical protein
MGSNLDLGLFVDDYYYCNGYMPLGAPSLEGDE